VACAIEATELTAQPVRAVPRPPAQAPGPPRPEDGSASPDGYAPIPEWLGQTRASRAAKTAAYDVETVAEGLAAAFSFSFLPDGRIIVGERPGRIRIVGKDGKVSEPIDGMPANLFVRGGQGLYEVRPDRAFAANRTIYLTYPVLPDGSNPAALPRSPGVVVAARATLSPDDKRLEDVKILLNAEGTGGAVGQGARWDPVRHLHDSGRPGDQLRRLASAAALRQQYGQGAAHQRRRIDSEGQPVYRPHPGASGHLRAPLRG